MFIRHSLTKSNEAPTSTGFLENFEYFAIIVASLFVLSNWIAGITTCYANYMVKRAVGYLQDATWIVLGSFVALLWGHLMYGMIRKYGPLVVGSAKVMPKDYQFRRQAGQNSPPQQAAADRASSKQEAGSRKQEAPLAETVLQGI